MTTTALARECHLIASGAPGAVDERVRAEAKQLAAEFEETLQMPQGEFEDNSRQAGRLAALKKRAIEILVRVHRSE